MSSSRNILGMTSTQSFGADDKDDMDVNVMVEGLIHSMEGPQTTKRSSLAVVNDEYSYKPASTRLTLSDESNQLLQVAEFDSHTIIGDKVARAQYRRKWLWRGFLFLCLISSLTVLALIVAKATHNASDASATTSKSSSYYVPKPPDDISTWCSAEYIASQGDSSSSTCQRVCNLAACCFSDNADTSCSSQYVETCALYSVCIGAVTIAASPPNDQNPNMDTSSTATTTVASSRQKIGPAPIDELTASCQAAAPLDACTSYCSLALCCFDPVKEQNCYTYGNNHIGCHAYSEFCQILGPPYGNSLPSISTMDATAAGAAPTPVGVDSYIMEPTNTTNASAIELTMPSHLIEAACSMLIEKEPYSDLMKRTDACQEACKPGYCCFEEGTDSCRENNAYVCSQYDICTFAGIFGVPSNIIPFPPKRVFHECNRAHKGSLTYQTCTKICSVASCCFDESSESCVNVDKSVCNYYEACLKLEGFNVQGSSTANIINHLRPPPEQLETDCLNYSMQGNAPDERFQPDDLMHQMEDGLLKHPMVEHGTEDQSINICSKTCHEAYCCFAVGADNCRANNLDICAMYDVCIFSGVSSRTSQSIPVAPEDISTHCDGALIATDIEAYHECAGMCAPAACCFDDQNDSCRYVDKTSCTSYQTCENLKKYIEMNPPVVANQTILKDPPSQLEESCTPLLYTFDGIDDNLCANYCRDGSCCFAAGDSNCRESNQNACAKYDICIFAGVEALSSDIIPTPPDDISITCSLEKIFSDVTTFFFCERMCSYATCCFASSDECIYVDKSPCNLYQSCSNLRLDSTSKGDSFPMSNVSVVPETNASASVPYSPDSFNATAAITSGWPSEMSHHMPEGFPGQISVRAPELDLPQICDGQDSSHEKCQNACHYSACCIDPVAENNCYKRSPHICQMYSPCSVINAAYLNMTTMSDESIVPSPPSDLMVSCAGGEGQSNPAGCRDACESARCCTSSINNCFEKNMEVCKQYEVCFIMPDVAKMCSESALAEPTGKAKCQDLCNDETCCFAPPPLDGCQSDWIKCVPYSPCLKLNS